MNHWNITTRKSILLLLRPTCTGPEKEVEQCLRESIAFSFAAWVQTYFYCNSNSWVSQYCRWLKSIPVASASAWSLLARKSVCVRTCALPKSDHCRQPVPERSSCQAFKCDYNSHSPIHIFILYIPLCPSCSFDLWECWHALEAVRRINSLATHTTNIMTNSKRMGSSRNANLSNNPTVKTKAEVGK